MANRRDREPRGFLYTGVDTYHEFRDLFRAYGRLDDFTYERLEEIYDYLVECAEGSDEPYKVDVIAICCEEWEEILGVRIANLGDVLRLINDYGCAEMRALGSDGVLRVYQYLADEYANGELVFTVQLDDFKAIDLNEVM